MIEQTIEHSPFDNNVPEACSSPSDAAVMELVGHDTEQMSAGYTHVVQDALKKAAAMLPVR